MEAGEIGNKQHYLIIELLGKSLKDVTREIKKVFSMKTVCQIGIQMVRLLIIRINC